jgi:hypothetical protein
MEMLNLKKCPVPFGIVPNSLLNDKDISLKAKGLFSFMQSKPDNWKFSVEKISFQCKEAKSSISEGLKELEIFGYLLRKKHQSGNGFTVEYHLHFEPIADFQSLEIQSFENPTSENPIIGKSVNNSNKDYSNKDISKKEVVAETAFDFFKINYQESFENLMMKFKNQINDFDYFLNMFNATCEQEKIPYEQNAISGRFKRYAFMWISNQSKFDPQVIELNPGPKQKIKCF